MLHRLLLHWRGCWAGAGSAHAAAGHNVPLGTAHTFVCLIQASALSKHNQLADEHAAQSGLSQAP